MGNCKQRDRERTGKEKGGGNIPTQMKEEDSVIWMMCHHFKAACTLLNVCLDNDLVRDKLLIEHLLAKSKEAEDRWEEHMWLTFLMKINQPENVVLFNPEIRGPD